MIVAIAQEDFGFSSDQAAFVVEQCVDDIAFWPDEAAQLRKCLFASVEVMDVVWGRFADHHAVELFEVITDAFEDREMIIDDGIDQRISEVIGPGFADEPACVADAFAYGVEGISEGFFLNGEDEVRSDEKRDLFDAKFVGGVQVDHLQDDEEVAVIGLNLGALSCVVSVFDSERVQVESRGELVQVGTIADPVEFDPKGRAIGWVGDLLDVGHGSFFEMRTVVVEETKDGFWRWGGG